MRHLSMFVDEKLKPDHVPLTFASDFVGRVLEAYENVAEDDQFPFPPVEFIAQYLDDFFFRICLSEETGDPNRFEIELAEADENGTFDEWHQELFITYYNHDYEDYRGLLEADIAKVLDYYRFTYCYAVYMPISNRYLYEVIRQYATEVW